MRVTSFANAGEKVFLSEVISSISFKKNEKLFPPSRRKLQSFMILLCPLPHFRSHAFRIACGHFVLSTDEMRNKKRQRWMEEGKFLKDSWSFSDDLSPQAWLILKPQTYRDKYVFFPRTLLSNDICTQRACVCM